MIAADGVGNSWTAGHRVNRSSSQFVWRPVTASSYAELPIGIFHWKSGEPNNLGGAEHCLMMRRDYSYAWDDSGCENQFNCICEIDLP